MTVRSERWIYETFSHQLADKGELMRMVAARASGITAGAIKPGECFLIGRR